MDRKIIEYVENDDIVGLKEDLLKMPKTDRSNLVNSVYINKTNLYHGANCLFVALIRNNFKISKFLIDECSANLETNLSLKNSEYWDNFTFFSYETIYGYKALFNFAAPILWHICRLESIDNLETVKFLITNGAYVNTTAESYLGSTPLMYLKKIYDFDLIFYFD